MTSYVKNHLFFSLSICGAIIFWILESFLHKYFFDEAGFEFIPHDTNELWMRIVILVLIIVIGYFADRQIGLQKKIAKERQFALEASFHSVNELVGNTLSLMSHYCSEGIESEKIDKESMQEMKDLINDTLKELKKISDVTNIVIKEKHEGYFRVEVAQPDKKLN